MGMDLDAKNEFTQMIFEIATDEGDLQARVLAPIKRLVCLKAQQVPESLRSVSSCRISLKQRGT